MKKAKITYTVTLYENGVLRLSNEGGSVAIKDTMDNIPLRSFIEADLNYEINKAQVSDTTEAK